ncbi:Hsp20/alpha crystallin family protein [Candidatus Nitrosocosmicus franklandus]|uniref:Heat-shock protein Hsp20 (Modular protein) n=1 Tax=Candidatus Nitrosocosmicus franklandianus TaxID=1798806 RepID=A0A484I9G8_9ARCH|nr:Hsp20/alpha crystallin family protein [Candidatus Nitrosocosmicus franklandus]VFJ13871.1 Heat-shock protein Hsp20 (modular protein) [Candidatus Nitrosocosmicus franklandus]
MSTSSSSSTSESSKNDSKNASSNKESIEVKNQSGSIKSPPGVSYPNYFDDFFETFRQNMQNMQNFMEQAWPSSLAPLRGITPFEFFDRIADTRLPVCDVIDRGDRYEINLEVPGINKEKIAVNATKHSVTISGSQTEKTKEKGKKYIYSERSYKSFHRQIPFTQEIIPSQINAKVKDGVLEINVPKKYPTQSEGDEEFKVNVS